MKKITVFYFSATGNTKRIAELYSSELTARGCEVTIRALPEKAEPADFDADMIGIGYPIHAFNAPENVLKAAKAFPDISKDANGKKINKADYKPVFVFKTSGEPVRMSDVSSLKLAAILKKRGYKLTNEYQYVMPYNIMFRHTDARVYQMWETAKRLVPVDVNAILSGKEERPKKMPFGGLLAGVMRIEHPGARILGRAFKTTSDCTKCGLCVRTCPQGNITLVEKTSKSGETVKKLKFGGKCLICTRCVFHCPKDAIRPSLLNPWRVNGAYSFEPPTEEEEDKHAKYCKKAYDRYYANAEKRINEYREKPEDTEDNQ